MIGHLLGTQLLDDIAGLGGESVIFIHNRFEVLHVEQAFQDERELVARNAVVVEQHSVDVLVVQLLAG